MCQPASLNILNNGNVVFDLKKDNELRIPLENLKREYEIKLKYLIPNKIKDAPEWEKVIRINKKIMILQDEVNHCHQTGSLKVKSIN